MVDLMMWLVIAALLLAAAIQSIGYYQQASLTYQAKSDLSGAHSWAAARTALDSKAPTSTEMSAALTAGDLKLTNNGGVYNIGVIATTGDKYCLGVKAPGVKSNNVFYSTSDAPNNVMTDVALPAFCGTATEVTTTGITTASPTSTATASPSPTSPSFTSVTWSTKNSGATSGYFVTLSADGKTLITGGNSVAPRASHDAGTTWAGSGLSSTTSYYAGGVSANGQIMVAAAYTNDYLHLSRDGGATWTTNNITGGPKIGYGDYALSADGSFIIAAGGASGLWMSNDSGTTWQQSATTGSSVAMSSTGKYIVAGTGSKNIKYSSNYGVSFTTITVPNYSSSIAISEDGSRILMGAGSGNPVYLSTDAGVSWAAIPNLPSALKMWDAVAMSSDGTKMLAIADSNLGGTTKYYGGIWTSVDSGVTWTEQPGTDGKSWKSGDMSSDGTKLTAVTGSGELWYGSFN